MSISDNHYLIPLRKVENAGDLALAIERLSEEMAGLRESGPLSFQDVQKAASSLTRAQLVLNELERIEIRERGAGSDMSERFAALESSIRALRDDLYRELTRRRTAEPAEDVSGSRRAF
jgi:hypothetical protein